ncbi:non-structural maintenance of chromosomes element 1 homolog [Drosophila grimshawi]|uniref:Non-structural maintenance of chromosomes element 1 homolog n=1 Tax=Drosophila grimshawi TaxID=7222 RepID=B4JPS2_DROGR|nr:non-structural maintenance of chromosomes element 1 homolog [Drosophila grimshawi]EDV98902.1 GH13573 [Drosophila grimshawi]
MDKVKRAFLRACINHSCLDPEQIDKILTPLCEHHKVEKPANKEALYKLVGEIENTIRELNQSLGFVQHPISGKEYLVFAITEATPDKLAHPGLSAEECQYFSIILDMLGQREDLCIAWNEAYSNVNFKGTATKPPTKLRMQTLLQMWNDMGYFVESDDHLYLGARSIVEFEFHLRSHYVDTIKECALCKKLVFWDVKCSDCGRKIHRECIRKYLRTRSNCPTCGNKWCTRLSQ